MPTILAGMDAIIVVGGRRTRDEWVRENLTALLGSIYFYVTMHSQRGNIDREIYAPARKQILSLLANARHEVVVKGYTDEEEAWEGWKDLKAREFNHAMEHVADQGWLNSDWYRGLEDVRALEESRGGGEDEITGVDGQQEAPLTQIRRADTMHQERLDFLNPKRLEETRAWKEEMLQKITDLEAANTQQAMDIDS
jgi:origin recognition complex subunit 6